MARDISGSEAGASALQELDDAAEEDAANREPQANASNSGAAEPDSHSKPLIALLPAQRRSRAGLQDLGKTHSSGGVHKVQIASKDSSSTQADEPPPNHTSRELRERNSAPSQGTILERELRESKSAPDLSSPALAAIRGLQAGTLQIDGRMRTKLAAAAKRVLEAREHKRRVSQERQVPSVSLVQGTDSTDKTACKMQKRDLPQSAERPAHSQTRLKTDSSAPHEAPQLPATASTASGHLLPQSLATAAAIARGEPLSMSSPPSQGVPDSGGPHNFHRPALSPTLQVGAFASGFYRPFTVTTGVPGLGQGPGRLGSLPAGPPAIAPSTPQVGPLDRQAAPTSPTQTSAAASMTLSAGDLHRPSQDIDTQ